ncbi:helix-turn-helix domain-containing protein [Romboutsia hominis]|uniref:helix-turn-helix domain-containing protein n=1 Tax=Romboutsia hominis TaxID=1507512 RepID=UPI001F05D504|nr:helix-turn-helix transcriptional regulator [Romboutsia hominis]MCH1959698.1 helix-turn-helix domain-containing protein [Romboutsia hominis]MCH1969879.1 helix-turn-helix domain-containing protein [Romboutsia hominis]
MDLSIIKDLRKEKNLSQKDLGNLLNVSGAYIQQVENNKTTPSLHTLNKIADALGVHVSTILNSSHDDINKSISDFMELMTKDSNTLQNSCLYLSDNFADLSPKTIENAYKLELSKLTKQISYLEQKISDQEGIILNKDYIIDSQSKFLDNSHIFLNNTLSMVDNLTNKIELLFELISDKKDN